MVKQDYSIGGSGSTYIYGYCDAHYTPNMPKEKCIEFVKTGTRTHFFLLCLHPLNSTNIQSRFLYLYISIAISHAMARDGSSGGVIRLAVIDKDGMVKSMVPGNNLPFNLV